MPSTPPRKPSKPALPAAFLALASMVLLGVPVQAQDGLKVYISADTEGVVGVVTADQLGPGGFEYEQAPRYLTEEVNAAVAGRFGVPVVMISWDDAIVEEVQALPAYLPVVDRVDSHTISFTGDDMVEVSRFLEFITNYSPDISP